MPNGGPCPRQITITIANGSISAQPPVVNIDRDCQIVRVNLVNDSSGSFASNPISFPWPVPPNVPPPRCGTFTQWPSVGTIEPGPGANMFTLNANSPRPGGATDSVCYKFDVAWVKNGQPQTFDPTIENDPYPPGTTDDLPDPAKGHPPRGPMSSNKG